MGDKITRPAGSADLVRAKSLKEALRRGTPRLSRPQGSGLPTSSPTAPDFTFGLPDVQKAYLEQLVECTPEAISVLNTQHGIMRINGEFTRLFGFCPEEALGRNIDALIVPSERIAETQWVGDALASGQRVALETKRQRKDGTLVDVFMSGAPVVVNGVQVAFYALYRDISEQKRAEEERRVLEDQFRQAQKMEAVGRLAGGVAHDFNNLLMVISGYSEVLLGYTESDSYLHPKIAAIQQAADRASSLTRQLLAFSRKQMLELRVVDVNAIVKDMERLVRPLIGENIILETRLASDLGRTRADAGQLEQVIMNLVVNAKDAMPKGGKITLETRNESLGDGPKENLYIQSGRYVLLSITDTGFGMDKETQSRIFEPFFTTKEKGKGTGLGLSTVYGIVKQSGGYIFAKSELGCGASFRIYLPQVEDALEPLIPVRHSQAVGGSETVLLVEDESSVRQLVRETLETRGYKVLEAENGETALQAAASHNGPIDILITDVVMPGISGQELSQKLCSLDPALKVLYLSGYTEDSIIHEGTLEAGTAFLQKPFTLQTLSRKVREVLRSHS
jgi:two-component system cell cycle sensor histidine kinase/response regulator CckA